MSLLALGLQQIAQLYPKCPALLEIALSGRDHGLPIGNEQGYGFVLTQLGNGIAGAAPVLELNLSIEQGPAP